MTVEYLPSCTWIPLLWYLKASLIIIAILGILILIMVKLRFRKRWLRVTKYIVCSLIILPTLGYSVLMFILGGPMKPKAREITHTLEKMPYYLSVPANLHYQVSMSRKDTTHYTANLRDGTFKMTFVETWCGCCGAHREIEYRHEASREMKNLDEVKAYLAELGISSNLINRLESKEDFYLAQESFQPGWPEESGKRPMPVFTWWDGSYELSLKKDGSVLLQIQGGYPP